MLHKLRLALLFFTLHSPLLSAQTYTTPYPAKEVKAAQKWADKGTWRNGFTKAAPDRTVNLVEFRQQVKRNPEQWRALFAWLESHDVTTLPKGKHPIEGTTMTVSIQDDTNKPLDERKSESHRKYIDFQWVVTGSEGFALLDHETSRPSMEYNPEKDLVRYDYDHWHTRFFTSTPGRFNIFFPGDWHIAKVKLGDDQPFRVVVVKVEMKD